MPYQSSVKRRQCAVFAFPFTNLSTKNSKKLKQPQPFRYINSTRMMSCGSLNLQKFPQDDGTLRWSPQGQQVGYADNNNKKKALNNRYSNL